MIEPKQKIKQALYEFWESESCGTNFTNQLKFSRAYFDEIETYRYQVEPEILEFAKFSDSKDKNVLEVGIGAGTDFLQWIRNGARAIGMDYTREALENVRHRLDVYELEAPILQADAENLPLSNNSFDLVYSWGVIHHTPDTWRALDEIVRVTKSGGQIKLMLYNRHSICALAVWLRYCLFAGKPWRSISWALHHHVESLGTKGYTLQEIEKQLGIRSISQKTVWSIPTFYDRVNPLSSWIGRWFIRLTMLVARLLGWHREGWFILIEFTK